MSPMEGVPTFLPCLVAPSPHRHLTRHLFLACLVWEIGVTVTKWWHRCSQEPQQAVRLEKEDTVTVLVPQILGRTVAGRRIERTNPQNHRPAQVLRLGKVLFIPVTGGSFAPVPHRKLLREISVRQRSYLKQYLSSSYSERGHQSSSSSTVVL